MNHFGISHKNKTIHSQIGQESYCDHMGPTRHVTSCQPVKRSSTHLHYTVMVWIFGQIWVICVLKMHHQVAAITVMIT